jgi:beta-lactamase class A
MQSVYKFPIGMAVLDRVDKGGLPLDREIRVDTSEYIPESGHSPLRDKFPEGTRLTVRQLLNCSVAESDGQHAMYCCGSRAELKRPGNLSVGWA